MRKTFVLAKSQQRPLDRWLVMGAPSKGIFTLKICWSFICVERERRTVFGSVDERAESASLFHHILAITSIHGKDGGWRNLFLGSCNNSCSQCSTSKTERFVHGALKCFSVVREEGVSFSSMCT